ncbi:MAG TPA: peroxiredoxin, partial [Acidimicrobiales bacterium]|nr:peroxiredoxin [Acidimicrobiales bacterium]
DQIGKTRERPKGAEMTIAVGDRIPDVQLKMIDAHGTEVVQTADVLGKGRVVLFGVPAAFSPTCSDVHLPGYVKRADEILGKGVDRIFCVSVNDPYVMAAWGRSQGVEDKVALLADGNADLARAMGVDLDLSKGGLGTRNRRYALVLEDGIVTHLALEEATGLDVSSADSVLAALS